MTSILGKFVKIRSGNETQIGMRALKSELKQTAHSEDADLYVGLAC